MVGLLAISAVFAGINFSGAFKAGYNFVFGEQSRIEARNDQEGKLTVKASDENGIWSVTLKGDMNKAKFDSGEAINANATISIDKLVSFLGGSMGGFTMKLSAGNNGDMTALSAYNDQSGDEIYKFKNQGSNSIQFAMGYDDLIDFNVAGDPTFDGTGKKVASIVVSVNSSPLDGLAVSLAYAFNGTQAVDDQSGHTIWFGNGFNAAADINIAKMCGFDFDLGVSVFDTFAIGAITADPSNALPDSKDNFNILNVNVYGGLDIFSAYAEYRVGIYIPNEGDADTVSNGFKVGVSSDCGVSGLSVSADISSWDVSDLANNLVISGGASYGFDGTGLTVAVNLGWENATKEFTLTPSIAMSF